MGGGPGKRTVTHGTRIPTNAPQYPQILCATQHIAGCFLIMSTNAPIKGVPLAGVKAGGGPGCRGGDVQVQRMPGLAVDALNMAAWQSEPGRGGEVHASLWGVGGVNF